MQEILHKILSEIQEMKQDIQVMKQEIQGLKQENQEIKQEIQGLKQESQEIKQEIKGLKQENQGIKQEIQGIKQEIQGLKLRQDEIYQMLRGWEEEKTFIRTLRDGSFVFDFKFSWQSNMGVIVCREARGGRAVLVYTILLLGVLTDKGYLREMRISGNSSRPLIQVKRKVGVQFMPTA